MESIRKRPEEEGLRERQRQRETHRLIESETVRDTQSNRQTDREVGGERERKKEKKRRKNNNREIVFPKRQLFHFLRLAKQSYGHCCKCNRLYITLCHTRVRVTFVFIWAG